MLGSLGMPELLLITGVVVLMFGGKKVAELGKGMGTGISAFRKGLKEAHEAEDEAKEVLKDTVT